MKKTIWNKKWKFSSDIRRTECTVNLPHDAMQTEKRNPDINDGSATGYYPGGIYTYTKKLEISEKEVNKNILLEFEGIYMKSSVYLNDMLVGGRIYGYSDFYVDLTGKVKVGSNEIKVIADNSQCPNSRWYSGSGIYRDVYLHMADEEYIKPDGMKITTTSINPPTIHCQIDAVITSKTNIRTQIIKNGEVLAGGKGNDVVFEIPDAKLWTAETPELYEVKAELLQGDTVIESMSEKYGIRMLSWNAKEGFLVNHKSVNLRGGCVHHDHGPIGAPEFYEACLRKVRIMKEAGFNAVRIAHHPASQAMLRACDEIGMYVMNESFDTWLGLKSKYDYAMYFEQEWEKDLSDMIRVSYNHPSVVMYSIGNEIYLKDIEQSADISRKMTDCCKRLDPTRAVIAAFNPLMNAMGNSKNPEKGRNDVVNPREPGKGSSLAGSKLANTVISFSSAITKVVGNEKTMRKRTSIFEPLDIVGFNYGDYLYDPQHQDYPERILCGSETFPATIDMTWEKVKTKPWVVGDFMWTAWDYLGEAGVGAVGYDEKVAFTQPFPTISAGCANIDLTGYINCQGYYTAIVFEQYHKPYIAVHPVNHAKQKLYIGLWRFTDAVHSWSWHGLSGTKTIVDVYSNADMVELFLDGKSLGKKSVEHHMATYEVTYQDGELKAVNYDKEGNLLSEDRIQTAGETSKIVLIPEKKEIQAGGRDLLYIPIEITDENGICNVMEKRKIKVEVSGAADLLAVGNGALTQEELEPYTGGTIETFHGRALAVLRSKEESGEIQVKVSTKGLDTAEIKMNALR